MHRERLRDDENSSKGKIYEKVLKLNTVVEKVWKRHLYTRVTRQGKKTRMSGRGNENGWERFYQTVVRAQKLIHTPKIAIIYPI